MVVILLILLNLTKFNSVFAGTIANSKPDRVTDTEHKKKVHALMIVNFQSTPYEFRWRQKDQFEFTPKSQEDLNQYSDMLTLNIYRNVNTGDQLEAVQKSVLTRYRTAGTVMKTISKPRTIRSETEHFAATAFMRNDFSEISFSRFLIFNKVGMVLVYSHRERGDQSEKKIVKWIKSNSAASEKEVLAWNNFPTLSDLNELPESNK